MNLLTQLTALFATKSENGLSPLSDIDTTIETELVETKSQPKTKTKKLTKKQQLENSKFLNECSDNGVMVSDRVDFYTDKLKTLKKSGRDSYITYTEKKIEMTFNIIKMGNTLQSAKAELSKKDYELVCMNAKVSERTIDRYLFLVVDNRISEKG